jgi:hypothetical protein
MVTVGPGGQARFDTAAVAVTDATNYVEVATIQASGRGVLLRIDVGAGGAIAHLKITQAADDLASDHNALAEDTDFASATVAVPYVLGSSIHQTAAGGSFQIRLAAGAAEYKVLAKKATNNTTVRVRGRFLP